MERKTSLKKSPLRKKRTLVGSSSSLRTKRTLQGQTKPNKRTLKPKKKVWKFKKTELNECDSAFSREIRQRDGRCMFPGCPVEDFASLQASHYFGRANWNTRFDPENMIALCMFHHFRSKDLGYEYQKQRVEKHGWDGRYTLRQKEILGDEGFQQLVTRSEGKKTRKEAIIETQKRYGLRQPIEVHENE